MDRRERPCAGRAGCGGIILAAAFGGNQAGDTEVRKQGRKRMVIGRLLITRIDLLGRLSRAPGVFGAYGLTIY